MGRPAFNLPPASINVAEAKRRFSELVGQVAFARRSVLITRRGRPMARLVPPGGDDTAHLADVKGWLDDDHPFFAAIDEIVAERDLHIPRVLRARKRAGSARGHR